MEAWPERPCARVLSENGIDAVAFERDRFPREKVCGEFLSPGAVAGLDRLGVLDAVRRAGAVRVDGTRLHAGREVIEVSFDRPGLGVSRRSLDPILARTPSVRDGCQVAAVERRDGRFVVKVIDRRSGDAFDVVSRVVIDAAGKLSRFTRRRKVDQFGVQYHRAGHHGAVLDFWFFAGGYGGAVSIEGERTNYCFLIEKSQIASFPNRSGRHVTGPISFERLPGPYLAIGDACGMMDPFCGEGIRHALESGILAGEIVGRGPPLGIGATIGCGTTTRRHGSVAGRDGTHMVTGLRRGLTRPGFASAGFRLGGQFPAVGAWILRMLWE